MTRGERAKQFAPYDAVKGLQEALRDREERHSRVEKRLISEEKAEEVSRILLRLKRGIKAEIECYAAFHDVTLRGTVTQVDFTYRKLKLDETQIWFDDIYEVRIIEHI